MRFHASPRTTLAAAALVTGALSLSACSAGSLGSSDDESGKTTISFLTNNDPNNVKIAEAVIKAFEAANDDIDVKLDTRPGGGDGDNLVKTKLSTGDMAEVFEYNSGSLFQAIAPTTNLTPITDEPWVGDLDETFASVVSAEEQVYGAPWGSITGGGIFYNIPVYEKLGLEVPETWDEFIANSEKIKAERRGGAGRADLRRHLDQPDPRAGEQPQRHRGGARTSPRTTPPTRRSSPRRPRPSRASSTCRSSTRPGC